MIKTRVLTQEKIRYIGHYDILNTGNQERVYSLAAAKKMDYICDKLVSLGYGVDIISSAYSSEKGKGNIPQVNKEIKDGIQLILTPTRRASNKLDKIIRVLQAKVWLFIYLIRNCKKGDRVIVYHNYEDAIPIFLAQKMKQFKLILQIEEQYAMVWNLNVWQRWKENLLLKYGKREALVVSEVLAERLQVKTPVVSYGNYSIYRERIPQKKMKECKTLIFTGMVESVRNGGFMALETMLYLTEEYRLFISGPIAQKDKINFFNKIEEINKKCNRNACRYLGVLDDESYENLLLEADIALNPQRQGGFGEFVFPSKILTYMAYGLPVVSTKGESIVKSELADLICFADDFTAESVAEAVKRVKRHDYVRRLEYLDEKFKNNISELLI